MQRRFTSDDPEPGGQLPIPRDGYRLLCSRCGHYLGTGPSGGNHSRCGHYLGTGPSGGNHSRCGHYLGTGPSGGNHSRCGHYLGTDPSGGTTGNDQVSSTPPAAEGTIDPEACAAPLRIPLNADPTILDLAREAISEHPELGVTHQAVLDGWVSQLYDVLQSPDFADRNLLAFTVEVLKYDREDVGSMIDSIHLLYPQLAEDPEIEDLFMLKMSHGLLVHILHGDTRNHNEGRMAESKDFYKRLSAMFSQSAHIGRKYDPAHLEAATVLAGYLLGEPNYSARADHILWYRGEGAELVTRLYEGFIPVLEDSYGDSAPKISDIISGTRAEVAAPTQAYEAPGSSDPTPTPLPTPEPIPEPWTEYLDFADSELLTLAARKAARPAYQESYGMLSAPELAPLDIEDRIEEMAAAYASFAAYPERPAPGILRIAIEIENAATRKSYRLHLETIRGVYESFATDMGVDDPFLLDIAWRISGAPGLRYTVDVETFTANTRRVYLALKTYPELNHQPRLEAAATHMTLDGIPGWTAQEKADALYKWYRALSAQEEANLCR